MSLLSEILERTGQIDWKSPIVSSRVDVSKDQRVNQVRLANYANEVSGK